MIFVIDLYQNVDVYKSLIQLVSSIEWQDILAEDTLVIDESGKLYRWDETKCEELGCTYEYTMKIVGENIALAEKCKEKYAVNFEDEFSLT